MQYSHQVTFPQFLHTRRYGKTEVSTVSFAQPFLHVPDNQMGEDATAVLCDPQTSGGMLCAIPSEAAATFEEEFAARCGRTPSKIGRVIEGESGHIHVVE